MKKIIISAVILIFCSTIAHAEIKNNILYNNKVFNLCCNLLDPLYIETGNSDWSNYGSVWEVTGSTLYLLGIDDDQTSGDKKADMKELFGDKYINGKVKAKWFTGKISIPDGKVFLQIEENIIYEGDNILYVNAGEITKTIVFDNTKKKNSTKKQSMLSPVINPDKSLFGISYGTGEDEFIARFGQPMKSIISGKTDREMMYGKKYIFLFKKTKLAGVKTASHEYEVYPVIPTHDTFEYLDWKLSNGITDHMKLAEVRKILETEGLTAKEVISNLPGKTLDVTQQVINLPIEAVKKITRAINPFKKEAKSKTQDTNKVDPDKSVKTDTTETIAPAVSVPAKGLEMVAGLPSKTLDVTQKVVNLPIEAFKKVTQAVLPSKSTDGDQIEITYEKGLKVSFSTKRADVELNFSRGIERRTTDEDYFVSGILVHLK